MAVSVDEVIQRIEDSGILDDAELSAVRSDAETAGGDSEKFVRGLVKNERLTAYQAQAIWRDKGHKLSFGNYIIEAELGRGGMGVVLKARHKRMKRYVAIKVLPATMTKDVDAIARFQREVEAAAQLTHPNIVGAHDADELNGQHFLVMEFVDGHDLSSVIKRNGPQSVEQAVNFTVQAARGLEFAHEQGVIHRDIKPANLLLDTKGTVKILDMGLARFSDNAEVSTQAELTGTGTVMGTVDYMSPEQALSTKTADARSDIYSLGITLYYLLTAKPAYEGDTLMARLLAHREHPIPSLRDDRPDIPDAVQHAFEKMVAKQSNDRFQSMTEVIAALENCPIESAATVVDLSGVAPALPGLPGESDLSKVLASGDESATDAESMAATATMPRTDTNAPTIITSSISNTIQTRATRRARTGPSGSGRPVWMSDKRILAGASVCILLAIVAFAMFSTETPEEPVESNVASISETGSTTSSPTKESTAAPESVTRDTLEAPPAAIAPFDADQAKAHQKAWAGYLGVPVEKEVELPGGEKMKFMLIPPGEFMMGTTEEAKVRLLDRVNLIQYWPSRRTFREVIPYETPSHRVRITRPFYLGKHEVTQAQWQGVTGSNPSESVIDAAHPVEMVYWIRVQSVIANLNVDVNTGGGKFALPTEAQWEFACRAGTTTFWHFGDDEFLNSEYGWFESNTGGKTRAVGLKRPNAFGLHDMLGNVREWCVDGFLEDYYAKSKLNDPLMPEGHYRVTRGGSSIAHFLGARSATRFPSVANAQTSRNGFRLAMTIDTKKTLTTQTSLADPDRAAAEWVLGIGGTVVTDAGEFKTIEELPQQPLRMTKIHLGSNRQVSDSGLEHLKGLKNLKVLYLINTKVTDAGLEHIKGMINLTNLKLGHQQVSDAGMKHLKELEKLEELVLVNTKVTDIGLEHIKGTTNLRILMLNTLQVSDTGLPHLKALKNLHTLGLTGTKVTAAGVADLQKALPKCDIEWGGAPTD